MRILVRLVLCLGLIRVLMVFVGSLLKVVLVGVKMVKGFLLLRVLIRLVVFMVVIKVV